MQPNQEPTLKHLSVHHVGNKTQQGPLILSETPVDVNDNVLLGLLTHFFLNPFTKVQETYSFYEEAKHLELNEIYVFAKRLFNGSLSFHEFSQNVCKHLFHVSNHPQIKGGEVYVTLWEDYLFEGKYTQAIGIFKSENKESYLKVYPHKDNFAIEYEQEAINIHKLDKGCLIINQEEDLGYVVQALDQTNRQQEAVYWKDHFLQVRPRSDAFHQTEKYMKVYKTFVTEQLDERFEMEKADKMDLLNKSMQFFKQKEVFKQSEFEEEVIGNKDAIALFNDYKSTQEQDTVLETEFSISDKAVKKMHATFRSVLKLDKNFHVYVHGKREYIEKGYDEAKQLHYYKLYFEKEN